MTDSLKSSHDQEAPNSYRILLGMLLLLFAVQPVLVGTSLGSPFLRMFYFLVFVAALYVVSRQRTIFWIGVVLAVLGIGIPSLAGGVGFWGILGRTLWIAFFLAMLIAFLKRISSHRIVTVETVCGALCIYLFMGLLWASAYELLETVSPGSFRGLTTGDEVRQSSEIYYYSFVTLTTLGYGDILPATSSAKGLATLEAILGQLYLAVLLARLVGLYTASESRRGDSE